MTQNEPISGLLLDETNPRFAEAVSGQDDAITSLLLDAPSKMINLARDIVTVGELNPTEIPVAVEEDGDLIIIEGNRRLACLKILANPDLASAAADELELDLVKRFRDLAKIGTAPRAMDVYVATDRESAKHWIELRHTGENDGVGVLEWASWQANNFNRRRGSQADRATVFCNAVEAAFAGNTSLVANVEKVRRNKLTTLGRLVADPDVRAAFGFGFENDGIVFYYPAAALEPGFERIFADLAGNLTVTEIKTKEQRTAFVRDRHEALPDRVHLLANPIPAEDADERNEAPGSTEQESKPAQTDGDGGEESPEKPRPKPAKAEPVIFHGLRLSYVNPRISKLLKAAQQINIDDSAQVSAVLIRVILELVVSEGIEKKVVNATESAALKKKLREALLALDPQCFNPIARNKSLEMAWTRTQDNDGMAVQSLHAFVHNLYGDPTSSEVRSLSTTFRPVLEGVDRLIGETK